MRGTFRMVWTGALALTFVFLATAAPLTTLSAAARAQDFRGSIIGRVNDSSGARLPGATVTATNIATNVGSTTTTNDGGATPFCISRQARTPSPWNWPASRSGSCVTASKCASATGSPLDLSLDVGRLEETVSGHGGDRRS